MRATDFEFRFRFWFFVLIFWMAFACYTFDPTSVVVAMAKVLLPNDPELRSKAALHLIHILFGISAAVIAVDAWMRTWGSAYLQTEVVHDSVVRAEKLVAAGPYRHLRNPLYFGNLLMAFGIGMYASRIGFLVLFIGHIIFLLRLIGREESTLIEAQGESYRAYLAAVPRLWPSLTPRVPDADLQPRWLQAFLGEAWIWCLALDGFLFAWKLNRSLYFKTLGGSAGLYFLMWIVLSLWRRQNASRNEPPESSPQSTKTG
jgi:protein-S-isoprenylcysteine O-methyltransferase Ste14